MVSEEQLTEVADKYRLEGYTVIVRPSVDDLPPFAKDFHPEILALRKDCNVLAIVKKNLSHLQAQPELPGYAGIISQQPGWRMDLFILENNHPPRKQRLRAGEPTIAAMHFQFQEIERMLQGGFLPAAFLSAWAVLEAAMRRYGRSQSLDISQSESTKKLLKRLVSNGLIRGLLFDELEDLNLLRHDIEHGFAVEPIDPQQVRFLIETAHAFLREAQVARQSA